MVKKLDNDIDMSHDDGPEYNPTSVTHTIKENLQMTDAHESEASLHARSLPAIYNQTSL